MRLTMTAAVVLAACISLPSPAYAINAGDVMDKMDSKQRAGFLAGAVDMSSYLHAVNGNQAKSACAVEWFFRQEDSLREVHAFLDAHKDKDAVGLVSILIDRHCGK